MSRRSYLSAETATTSTGIYETSRIPINRASIGALKVSLVDEFDIDQMLETINAMARAILEAYGVRKHPWSLGAKIACRLAPHEIAEYRNARLLVRWIPKYRKQIEDGERRSIAAWGLHIGAIYERMSIRWAEPHVQRELKKIAALRRQPEAEHLGRLARIVVELPKKKWVKMTTGVRALQRTTKLPERSLWRLLDRLRAADAEIIDTLAKATSLSEEEVARRISMIPRKRNSTATR